MNNHTTAAQRRNARSDAIFDRACELAARKAGWAPIGPHGKWVLAGDKHFSQGSYMPTDRACRYICLDHDLLALKATTKTPGQLAYEAECAIRPNYHDGAIRRDWSQLSKPVQETWERNPTPRWQAEPA